MRLFVLDRKHRNAGNSPFGTVLNFFTDIFKSVAKGMLVVAGTFVFATAVSAGILWFYNWPLFFAPVGGFIVLGVMMAFWYDQ